VEVCIRLSYKELGRFLLVPVFSRKECFNHNPRRIQVFSTICFSRSIIGLKSLQCDIIFHFTSLQSRVLFANRIIRFRTKVEARAKKHGCASCNDSDPLIIDYYQKFLEALNRCTLKKIPQLLYKFHQTCTINTSTNKLIHTNNYYIDLTLCDVSFCSVIITSFFKGILQV